MRAQDIGDAVRDEERITRIGDQRCQALGNAQAPFDGGQQHDPTVEGHTTTIERRGNFLAADGWKQERRGRIVGHGGYGSA